MGYLKVSRELLNSSFWRSLAPAEKGILIDLMAMAAYKPTSFNLYGTEIELEKYELCFSVLKIANKYRVTEYAIRSLIKKLENAKILTQINPSFYILFVFGCKINTFCQNFKDIKSISFLLFY